MHAPRTLRLDRPSPPTTPHLSWGVVRIVEIPTKSQCRAVLYQSAIPNNRGKRNVVVSWQQPPCPIPWGCGEVPLAPRPHGVDEEAPPSFPFPNLWKSNFGTVHFHPPPARLEMATGRVAPPQPGGVPLGGRPPSALGRRPLVGWRPTPETYGRRPPRFRSRSEPPYPHPPASSSHVRRLAGSPRLLPPLPPPPTNHK